MGTKLMENTIKESTKELLERIQRDHPYTQDDLELSIYKTELTNEEENIYMAYCVWQVKKDLDEGGKYTNRKVFLTLFKDINFGSFKWVKSWLNEFYRIKEIHEHLQLILEFHTSRHWHCLEYERLRDYKETILNAYLNIKKSDKTKEDHIQAFENYQGD